MHILLIIFSYRHCKNLYMHIWKQIGLLEAINTCTERLSLICSRQFAGALLKMLCLSNECRAVGCKTLLVRCSFESLHRPLCILMLPDICQVWRQADVGTVERSIATLCPMLRIEFHEGNSVLKLAIHLNSKE